MNRHDCLGNPRESRPPVPDSPHRRSLHHRSAAGFGTCPANRRWRTAATSASASMKGRSWPVETPPQETGRAPKPWWRARSLAAKP